MADDNIVVTKQPILNASSFEASSLAPQYVVGTSSSSFDVRAINIWTIGRYVLIIVISAFLGFNIFSALGIATDNAQGFLASILSTLGFGVGETIKQTVDTTAKGTKTGVDVVAATVDDAVTLLEKTVGANNVKFNRVDKKNLSTEKAITNALKKQQSIIPQPDDSTSSTQKNQKGKSGYCYIGEDRGFRSCIKVGEGDKCMSGDIFPTNEICINPNLRE